MEALYKQPFQDDDNWVYHAHDYYDHQRILKPSNDKPAYPRDSYEMWFNTMTADSTSFNAYPNELYHPHNYHELQSLNWGGRMNFEAHYYTARAYLRCNPGYLPHTGDNPLAGRLEGQQDAERCVTS